MMRAFHLGLCLIVSALAACGSKQEEPAPPPVRDTAFGDLARAEDKAREVEATLQKEKQSTDAAIEANEAAK